MKIISYEVIYNEYKGAKKHKSIIEADSKDTIIHLYIKLKLNLINIKRCE